MKYWYFTLSLYLFSEMSLANDAIKKAFLEGIKASVEVVKYEREQALKAIPEGYCVTIVGTENPLDMWEEVKLESLALFLKMRPSLLESNKSQKEIKKVLCLNISKEKEQAVQALNKIKMYYPKIDEYITKVEILPVKTMHRVIPGVGEFFENKEDEIKELKLKLTPDRPLNGRIVLLNKKERSKTLFDNGSTRVVGTVLTNVSYVEHTVYRRKGQ